ncbi:MAG: hypothetical protein FWE05_09390 [Defluviitaleaceae bacterium]|nr:hypothetical protein [Defluviitaleaceae bacterium]
MTHVYSDMSASNKVFAWGCLIVHESMQYTFSGHCAASKVPYHGEAFAVVQALEKLSAFDVKDVLLYTDYKDIVEQFNAMKMDAISKRKGTHSIFLKHIAYFTQKYNLEIYKVHRERNPAHDIAHSELLKARKDFLTDSPPEIPDFIATQQAIETCKYEKSHHKIIRKYLSKQLGNALDFNTRIVFLLDRSVKQEPFHDLLNNYGINLSSFYQLLRNRFPKAMAYKQNGEKKLPTSFAKALQGSKYCVCKMNNGLFFIFYRDTVPETATILAHEDLCSE